MTSDYYRQRIWTLQQKRSKLEQTTHETETKLKKLKQLSTNIQDTEASFIRNVDNSQNAVLRMRLFEQPTKSQEAFVKSMQAYLTGQDYQHTQDCFSIMKRRSETVIAQTERELSQIKQNIDSINREITQLHRQLEAAVAQETAQGQS